MTRRHANEVYRDEGCDSFPACLSCPLDVCKYEDQMALLRWKNQGRDNAVAGLTAQGLDRRAIATQLGIAERTVSRINSKRRLNG